LDGQFVLFKEESCVFDENHTNKYLMCGGSNNQATKTKCMEVINTSKGRKQREKERENTKEFLYSVRSKTDLL